MLHKTLTFQDYNYIEHLGERAFAPVSPRRLYLGHNRITDLHNQTFEGLENILVLVRFSSDFYNLIIERIVEMKPNLFHVFLNDQNKCNFYLWANANT